MKNRIKLYLTVMAAVCLSGCTQTVLDVQQKLDQRLAPVLEGEAPYPNYDHTYYAYYADPSLGRISSHLSGNTFACGGEQFVMNLKVASVINGEYYKEQTAETAVVEGTPLASDQGVYTDCDSRTHEYTVNIYSSEEKCLVCLDTDTMAFTGISKPFNAADMAAAMLRVARSVRVNQAEITAAFSNLQQISYVRKPIELFQFIAPESGAIAELFPDNTTAIGEVGDLENFSSYQSLDYSKRRIESDEYDYYQFVEEDQ